MNNEEFLLPLNGLAHGKVRRDLEIGREFFESFGNTGILDADIRVAVTVDKAGNHTGVDCSISGKVSVPCDRCLEPVTVPVETTARLNVKFGEEGRAEDDRDDASEREIVWLPADSAELDLAQVVYDYVCLSLPARCFHPEGECNPEVLKYLDTGIRVSSGEDMRSDNPFAALEGIFGNQA